MSLLVLLHGQDNRNVITVVSRRAMAAPSSLEAQAMSEEMRTRIASSPDNPTAKSFAKKESSPRRTQAGRAATKFRNISRKAAKAAKAAKEKIVISNEERNLS
ncbi:MAG: hypothetical protein ACREP5_11030 [Candidatus Binatia bacterium]